MPDQIILRFIRNEVNDSTSLLIRYVTKYEIMIKEIQAAGPKSKQLIFRWKVKSISMYNNKGNNK